MRRLFILACLLVSACTRADDAGPLPPQSAPTRAAYIAPSVTPLPPPTWTPHVQMTRQAVEATAIYLQAEQQRVDHAARLYAITEQAAQLVAASAETQAAAQAERAIAERDAARAGAVATADMIRERATADTAYIRTALPPRATAVKMEAEAAGMERVTWTALSALAILLAALLPSALILSWWLREKRVSETHARTEAEARQRNTIEMMKANHLYGPPAPVIVGDPPAPSYVERAIRVNGYSPGELVLHEIVDARERGWRLAGVRALEWADRLGGISQPRMLAGNGGPFASAEDWQLVTDFLAANGYIVKPGNGKRTMLSPEYPTWRAAALALADARRPVTYDKQSDPVPIEDPDPSPTLAPAPARV